MMSIFKNLLKDRRTSADFAAAIDEAETALRADQKTLEAIGPERRALLLDGTDADIRAAEAKVADVELRIDRAQAAIAELALRRDAAADQERKASATARHKEGELARQAYIDGAREYEVQAAAMSQILEQCSVAHATLQRINRELAGELPPIESPSAELQGKSSYFRFFHFLVELPASDGHSASFWHGGALGGGMK